MDMTIDTASGQIGLFDEAEEYEDFEQKFKAKKTTDDCYTPANIYAVVADWVAKEYGRDQATFVRPFWPGADFTATEYPDGCVVVDNPPFSLRAQIVDFYLRRHVDFFLFSPALTLLTRRSGVCHIATGCAITYENGAEVPTSFVTNLDEYALRTAPDLYDAIERENKSNLKEMRRELPKYIYPDEVVTAAIAQRWCKYGVDYRLKESDAVCVGALDAQKETGKSIFGYGFLLSERAAAERAAAERAAAERAAAERAAVERAAVERSAVERAAVERWQLSPRERDIVANLGRNDCIELHIAPVV